MLLLAPEVNIQAPQTIRCQSPLLLHSL